MSDFTKKWRIKHGEPLNYNERVINSACDIIEQQDERIEQLGTELEQHRWIPVNESLPKEGKCLVLCEEKVYEVKVRISEDEWEDKKGKSFMQETTYCDIRGLGCILIGHDACITHWKKP